MLTMLKTFARNEKGATAIEYGLIAALIAIALITALTTLGGSLSSMFDTVASSVDTAAGGSEPAAGS